MVPMEGKRKPLDLISVTHGDCHIVSFLSQSFGMIAEVDLGTEHLRWMGDARFTAGLLQRISKKTAYPCDIAVKVAIDNKVSIRDHYRTPENENVRGAEELLKLEHGTVNDPLPEDWSLIHGVLVIFYAGNVCYSNFIALSKLMLLSP